MDALHHPIAILSRRKSAADPCRPIAARAVYIWKPVWPGGHCGQLRSMAGCRSVNLQDDVMTTTATGELWRCGCGDRRGVPCLPLIFMLSENSPKVFLWENSRPEMQNLKLKLPHFAEFKEKIQTLSTHNILRWKFAAVCRNSVGKFRCLLGK